MAGAKLKIVRPLALTPVSGRNWATTSDFEIIVDDLWRIQVLAGFVSDGESGPRALKALLLEYDSRQELAAWPHDGGYQAGLPKAWCDRIYHRILLATLPSLQATLRYEAVHLFGESSYVEDSKDIEKVAAASSHFRVHYLGSDGLKQGPGAT